AVAARLVSISSTMLARRGSRAPARSRRTATRWRRGRGRRRGRRRTPRGGWARGGSGTAPAWAEGEGSQRGFTAGTGFDSPASGVACPFTNLRLEAVKPLPEGYPAELRTVGDHVRARRLDLGLTQAQAAMRMGVSVDTATSGRAGHSPSIRLWLFVIGFSGTIHTRHRRQTLKGLELHVDSGEIGRASCRE